MTDQPSSPDASANTSVSRGPSASPTPSRTLRIEVPIDDAADVALLRGALLAARATELAEARRRELRHSAGYGSDSARATMTSEATQRRRRLDLLDRLLVALDTAVE